MPIAWPVALVPLLAAAAWLDLRERRIPNWLAGATALLGLTGVAGIGPEALLDHLLVALCVLGTGIVAWRCRWLGGGDVKLLAALALWAGSPRVGDLLLGTALAGGILAMGMLLTRRIAVSLPAAALWVLVGTRLPARITASAPRTEGPMSLPYGVAIACGGLWLARSLAL